MGADQIVSGAASSALAHGKALAASGKRVVAVVGWRVPVEVIRAAGCQAVQLSPDLTAPTPVADDLLSAEASPQVRALIQMVVGGTLDFADLIVLAPPYAPVSVQLEDLRRMALIPESVPPSYYFETMMLRGDAQRAFAIERTRDLARRIASLTGEPIEEDLLEAEIAASNELRQAAATLLETRKSGKAPSGSAVISAIAQGDWLAPEVQVARIRALADNPEEASGGPRLMLVSSSVLGDARLHTLVEEAGANVVAEDDIYGSCFSDGLIDRGSGDPLHVIGSYYHDNQPLQRTAPQELRRQWFHDQLQREDIDGVVFYAEDRIWGWDVPAMRAAAEELGKPTATLQLDVRRPGKADAAREQLAEFVQSLTQEALA